MGFIADLSRYDSLTAVDSYPDGVILNIEDPGFAEKRDRAIAKGIPWGTYSWVYPGQGAESAQRAHDVGTGPLGAWLDYEQDGVSPADLSAALARADLLGMKLGVYTYLYILPTVETLIGDHPLWLAYYPGQNDGSYQPGYSNDARNHGALLHQFTSSDGTRDLSVVLDDARWASWSDAAPAPAPAPSPGGISTMFLLVLDGPNAGLWALWDGLYYKFHDHKDVHFPGGVPSISGPAFDRLLVTLQKNGAADYEKVLAKP